MSLTNCILASLPAEDFERLSPHLTRVTMRRKELLYRQDSVMDTVYFPGGGVCSLLKSTEEGLTTEIGSVGAEGVVSGDALFLSDQLPCDVVVTMPGLYADVLPADVFKGEIRRQAALYNVVMRYSQAFMMQIIQTAVCNGLHSAKTRICRTLLSAHDRAGADEFAFTHDLVALALGIRRPTVTLILGELSADGLIQHRRGRIRIVNRTGLEGACCECYGVVRHAFAELLPGAVMTTAS
jgi:CRP-like cAMP-binding protein